MRQSSLKISTRSPGSFLLFVEFSLCKYGRNVRPVQTAWWFYCYLWSQIDDWWGSQPNPTQSENSLLQNSWAEQSWILWTFNICVKGRRDLFIHESKFTHDPSLLWTLIIKVDYVRRSRFHSSTTSFFMALLRLLNFSDFKNLHDRVMSLMTVAVKLYIYI